MTLLRRLHDHEEGTSTLTYTVCVGYSLIIFALLANAIVAFYGRGVVRAALDEGVRSGSRTNGGAAACQQRAEQTVGQLLGELAADVQIVCADTPTVVTADATATFAAWMPGVPAFTFELAARGLRRQG